MLFDVVWFEVNIATSIQPTVTNNFMNRHGKLYRLEGIVNNNNNKKTSAFRPHTLESSHILSEKYTYIVLEAEALIGHSFMYVINAIYSASIFDAFNL